MQAIGQLGIVFALIVLAQLSKQLGMMTHAKPYYRGFYVAAALLLVSSAVRLLNDFLLRQDTSQIGWVILYDGLPAIAISLGVVVAWRYWSWLLAERD
ncbi:MAG: hypothetical protein IPO91_04165 [Chloroflexi bacterium]|nr:hypothetical protein [Chloroflexota bacterium]